MNVTDQISEIRRGFNTFIYTLCLANINYRVMFREFVNDNMYGAHVIPKEAAPLNFCEGFTRIAIKNLK